MVLHENSFETGRPNITQILLQYGADPTITNDDGKTPLDIAIEHEYIINGYLNTDVKEPVRD